MTDYIITATVEESIRIYAATTKWLVNKSFEIHKTTPVATAALGRLLTAAALMGAMLKNDTDLLTISVKGDGPLKGVVATGDNKSRVKGYVYNKDVNIPLKPNGKLDVGGAVGFGTLTVTKDQGLKEPTSGQISLVSGEIADDLTYYYAKSEQIPSSVALGVLVDTNYTVKQAGGFIIQVMPNAKEEVIVHLEQALPNLPTVTSMLDKGLTPKDMVNTIFSGLNINFYDKIFPEYYCNCSREKTTKALISIGKEEIKAILKEDKEANIHCHFCGKDYKYTEQELRQKLKLLSK